MINSNQINPSPDPSLNNGLNPIGENYSGSPSKMGVPLTEFQPLESSDILDSGQVVIQQFISTQRWGKNEYQADPSRPVLQMPDPEGGTAPTPFEPAWQKAVNKFFQDRVRENVIKKYKEESPESQKQIIQSLLNGDFESLDKEKQEIVEKATTETQTAWSLPKSWSLGTQKASNWTPIKADVVPPVSVEESRKEVLTENLVQLATSMETASLKVENALPPNDPKRIPVGELIKIIAQAISDLKSLLQTMQIRDAEISTKMSKFKYEQISDRTEEIANIAKKQGDIRKAQSKQEKTAKIMKIVAPCISGLVILIGCVATAFTGPAGIAVVYAGIAVGTLMLGYTIADGELNLTSQAIEAFNSSMDDRFKNDPVGKDITKAFILIAVLTLLLAAIMASGGAAAPTIGTEAAAQTSTQVSIQVAKEMVKQMTIQVAIMFIMASNIVPELVCDAIINCGFVNKDDEKTLMIIQTIIMALTMILVIGMISKFGVNNTAEGGASTGAKVADKSAKAAADAEKAAAATKASTESLKESNTKILDAIKQILSDLKDSLNPMTAGRGLLTLLSPEALMAGDYGRFAMQLQDFFRIASLGIESGTAISNGLISLQIVDILRDLGELEKSEELTQMLIQLLERLVKSFQEGAVLQTDWLNNLNGAMDTVYASGSQTMTTATQNFISG